MNGRRHELATEQNEDKGQHVCIIGVCVVGGGGVV